MLTLNMQNMTAPSMDELSKNLNDIADSIKDGYSAGVMRPGCIWKVEGEEEKDNEEKVFRITFRSEVYVKSTDIDAAAQYFEAMTLLSAEALEHCGEVVEVYEVEQCK